MGGGQHLLGKGLLGRAGGEGDALLGVTVVVGGAGQHASIWVARGPDGDV